ncbi:MAG: bifunctional folylpolyglutamate synthase/dihydrofolate synthase [Planctomycetes bacterium]|jgi:dihydrofolate synthase/folylpolyglutamate synthase|nr:bifunctional folylpolyglutamate synthase/dihydrofolate synthase [Planctomycetota bacterium]
MNYKQAYDYLLSLNNFSREEKRKNKRDWHLKRVQFFLNFLNNPEKQIPHYIHVAGTSGKGSVCFMLSSILGAWGKKVGLLNSPHPSKITERWLINNQQITDSELAKAVNELVPSFDKYFKNSPYPMLSFIETTVALGFYFFKQKKIDWGVIETGLGGRYDSTNVLPHKDIAIITNIGLDHTDVLGKTKKEIAYEKAGIIQKNCLVVIGEKNKTIQNIIKQECQKKKAPFIIVDNDYQIIKQNEEGLNFIYKKEKYHLPRILGEHQIRNAILAINTAQQLGISLKAIKEGLARTSLPVRMELFSQKPLIILDGAHNTDKMKSTVEITKKIQKNKKIYLLIGFTKGKDYKNMLKELITLKPKKIICSRFTNNQFRKVVNPREIQEFIKKISPQTKTDIFLQPQEALKKILKEAKTKDIILVTGSLFLSGEIRNLLCADSSFRAKP